MLFRFPTDETARNQWLNAISVATGTVRTAVKWSGLCSAHFAESAFFDGDFRRRLKPDAVPCKFGTRLNSVSNSACTSNAHEQQVASDAPEQQSFDDAFEQQATSDAREQQATFIALDVQAD